MTLKYVGREMVKEKLMKIIIVDSLFTSFGGGQKIAYATYRILRENGHEVFYWAMIKEPYFISGYECSKYFTPYYSGIKDYLKNPIKYYINYRAVNDLQKFVNIIKPDVIHFHSFWGLSSAIFNVKTNAYKILTMHDARCCPATTFMYKNSCFCKKQYCKNGNFLPCIINKCVENSLEASIRRAVVASIDVKNFKNVDYFITPSNALKDYVIKSNVGINSSNVTTIPNFLPDNTFNTIPNYRNRGYFLYLGRLSPEKGVQYLLEALKDLPKDIKLHIVGTGSEEESLKNYANEHNLDNVEFLGFKTGEELKEEYQRCIAVIVPSNWFEIFGLVNIEAFINGKPVIASNIGGIPEIVEHNVSGLLFEPGNVEQLKECILKYRNNPQLVVEHGKNGYQKAITQYTEDRYYKALMKVYEDVINTSINTY